MNSEDMKQRQLISKEINKILKKNGIFENALTISVNDIRFGNNKKYLFWSPEVLKSDGFFNVEYGSDINKFQNYILSLSKDRKHSNGKFYHYIRYEYALKAISQGFQFGCLQNYINSDPFEFNEFLNRYTEVNKTAPNFFDHQKRNTFILCLSHNYKNDDLWKNCGIDNKDNGICLGLKYKDTIENEDQTNFFHFRDIHYDKGNDFDFLREINYYLKHNYQIRFFPTTYYPFTIFYKRYKFNSEIETRLCFDYNYLQGFKTIFNKRELPQHLNFDAKYPIMSNSKRTYIEIPKKLIGFFNIQITEIICGRDITVNQFNKLEQVKDANTKIWRNY